MSAQYLLNFFIRIAFVILFGALMTHAFAPLKHEKINSSTLGSNAGSTDAHTESNTSHIVANHDPLTIDSLKPTEF